MKKTCRVRKYWSGGHLASGDAQFTVMSENLAFAPHMERMWYTGISGRLQGTTGPSAGRQETLREPGRMCTITMIGYSPGKKKKEIWSRESPEDSDMTFISQGRSLGYRINNLTQIHQLTVLVGDFLVQLNGGMLVPATTAVTKHSTQSSSALSQPDLAILHTAHEVSISAPNKPAIAVAEDVVQVQIGLVLRSVGTPAEGLQCHCVVVEGDVAG